MGHKIILCGGNGAGKSTVGRLLARRLGWPFRDVENYYFPCRDGDNPYAIARTREEVAALLAEDLQRHEHMIFAAVKGDFGPTVEEQFTGAVLLCAPEALRMARVEARSRQRFGERMLPGGDLWEQEQRFFRMVAGRDPQLSARWAETLRIPVLRLDATLPPEESVAAILRAPALWAQQR